MTCGISWSISDCATACWLPWFVDRRRPMLGLPSFVLKLTGEVKDLLGLVCSRGRWRSESALSLKGP